jgi:hypothetical protein
MNVITRKHLSRRHVLRGAGVTMALPFLSAMVPAATALAQTAAAGNRRLAFVYFPHGAVWRHWQPKGQGSNFEMSTILKPLEKHKARMAVISNLGNRPAESEAVHAITSGTWLSCVHPRASHSPFGGTTVDQVAAKILSADTTFPSIEACTEVGSTGGNGCDRNYGCSYGSTISFKSPTQPLPMENDPKKLFYRLFGVGDTEDERSIASNEYASLLDLVGDQAKALRGSLGAEDKGMLDNYLDSVREIEVQVKKKESKGVGKIKLPPAPTGVYTDFDKQLNTQFDLLALAFQADLTRVANMMMVNEGTNQTYNMIGIQEAFHPLSHHQGNPTKEDRVAKIQTYHSVVFAKFLDKLAAMPDGEHSVLDNAIVMYGSNMGNSNAHDHYLLPTALFGGKIKGGQHIVAPEHTPLANVHLTLLDRMNIEAKSFGDSTGMISEL